jgi:hypothetical protein
MNQEKIENLLHQLSDRLIARGLVGEIALYGGAAMVLALKQRCRRSVRSETGEIYEKVTEVSFHNGFDKDWLNDAVNGFLSEKMIFCLSETIRA